jgi:hypothetical protein
METNVYSDLALHGALIMSKNETGFPANPALGTIVIKDYCIYAYIKLGTMETWFPFSKATNSYVHVQGLESTQWIVQHNLGTTDVWFQVTGPTGNIVMVGKTDIDENSFKLDFTSAISGRCVVVAPDSINVPQMKASIVNVANGAVIIDSSGVLINGSYALTASNISQQIADAIATKDNSDEITEGTTNIYFTNTRARAAVSVTDNGGDGSLSYDNGTGVITYTGPSASEVRAHFSNGTGISLSSGQISVDNTIATVTALNSEISRAQSAEASIAASVTALGNAFNYVGTVSGGASSGAAYDLSILSQKDAGDYYKVIASGYFKVGTGGSPFYANQNDGLTWNLSSGVDIIDNTNSTVTGTINEITVSGSVDTGYTVALSSTFSGRMTSAESNINAEITRATNAESTLNSAILTETSRAQAAEASLASALSAEISRAQAAEASLSSATIDGGTF